MQIIPISDVVNQSFSVVLAGQSCQINLYQQQYTDSANPTVEADLITSLFIDLYINNSPIITGVICQNLNRIVRDVYLGFVGDLMFQDTTNAYADPISPGLGTQFLLCYLELSDLNGAG